MFIGCRIDNANKSPSLVNPFSDFFHNLRRTHVVRAIEKQRDLVRRAVEMADELIGGEEFAEKIDAQLEELGKSFASSLPSLESTPDRTPGAN